MNGRRNEKLTPLIQDIDKAHEKRKKEDKELDRKIKEDTMDTNNTVGVVAKISPDGKVLYMKAKSCTELPRPVIGEPYKFCGLITSPVESYDYFTSVSNNSDLTIVTKNSTYLCFISELDNVKSFAKLKGLPDINPDLEKQGLYYWGFDERSSTYSR